MAGESPEHIDNYPRSSTFLHLVAGEGLTSLAEWYLKRYDGECNMLLEATDHYGRTPLHEASRKGHVSTVKLFLKVNWTLVRQADSEGATPLHHAAEAGQTRVIETLISYGADMFAIDQYQNNSLHRAVVSSETDAARIILKKMFEKLKTPSSPGLEHRLVRRDWTLLHQAAGLGYEEGVEWLLLAGLDPTGEDKWGDTPLHRAAVSGHVGVLQKILRQTKTHISPNHRTAGGNTPLHFAAMYGHKEAVEVLLSNEFGADPSLRDLLGFTALHWAAAGGRTNVVELLLGVTEIPLPAALAPSPFNLASWGDFHSQVQIAILKFYSLPPNEYLAQAQNIRTVDAFGLLESGAQTAGSASNDGEEPDTETERRSYKLSMLLKFWAGIEMERKREHIASSWLDLDMVYLRDAGRIADLDTNLRHIQICDHCGVQPIPGYRYRCTSCTLTPWFDLCSDCHQLSHVSHPHRSFLKVPSTSPLPSLETQLERLTEEYVNAEM